MSKVIGNSFTTILHRGLVTGVLLAVVAICAFELTNRRFKEKQALATNTIITLNGDCEGAYLSRADNNKVRVVVPNGCTLGSPTP
jgi:hypothetical protein